MADINKFDSDRCNKGRIQYKYDSVPFCTAQLAVYGLCKSYYNYYAQYFLSKFLQYNYNNIHSTISKSSNRIDTESVALRSFMVNR